MPSQSKPLIAVCDLVTSFGGVQRVMSNLLPALAEDFDITVIDPYRNTAYADMLEQAGIASYFDSPVVNKSFIGGKGSWMRLPLMAAALPRLLKIRKAIKEAIIGIQPSAIYTNQLSALRLLFSIRFKNIPVIYHAHGFATARDIPKSAVQSINRNCAAVIAVSQSAAEILHQAGVSRKLLNVCYNAVPVEAIEKAAQKISSAPLPSKEPGQAVFLLPASVQRNKGHHLAIEALDIVIKKGYEAALWFAGDVTTGGVRGYLEHLQTIARNYGIDGQVHFLGWRNDIYNVMKQSDVVILCSTDSESFGMVLAEAMVLGKPCIGAAVGGIPEVIEDGKTGLLFEKGSSASLAEAMIKLMTVNDTRAIFAAAGKLRAGSLFSIQSQHKQIRKIILNALQH